MFKSAKLKLTSWYLLIIMVISLTFSSLLYQGVTIEYQRRINNFGNRLWNMNPNRPLLEHQNLFLEEINQARKRLLMFLIYLNSGVFVFSAAAGYFLADKTLSPIEQAMEEQQRFIADASHELRTPLTALISSIEVALRDEKITKKEAKTILKSSLEEVNNLNKLTNGLLSLTWYQQNRRILNIKNINIEKFLESIIKKLKPLANKKKISINFSAPKNILISADKSQLEKLITILVDNAIKYTPKNGKITIKTNETTRHTIISIQDTGIGINHKDLPHIFDRFYQADTARTVASGFGLGLSIAQQIVKLHSGLITVKSQISKGSIFIIKFPKKQPLFLNCFI